jgi:hypothetical protein
MVFKCCVPDRRVIEWKFLDDASRAWCVPYTMRPLNVVYLGRCVPWIMRPWPMYPDSHTVVAWNGRRCAHVHDVAYTIWFHSIIYSCSNMQPTAQILTDSFGWMSALWTYCMCGFCFCFLPFFYHSWLITHTIRYLQARAVQLNTSKKGSQISRQQRTDLWITHFCCTCLGSSP